MNIVDAHIHIWDLENIRYQWLEANESILNQTYHLHQLEDERKEAGVTHGILVQAENHYEDTEWMLKNAKETDWIRGVVGWLPLLYPAKTSEGLEQYSSNPYYVGMRHLIHDEADPKWLLQEPVLESLQLLGDAGLPFDVVGVLTDHIETVLKVAEKVPNLKMVFDHLNQPPIPTKEKFGKWGELMSEAAQNPNFYQKISGQGTASGNFESWSGDDIKPYIEFVLEQFGADRCFMGGDWPVSLLAGSYSHTWSIYKELLFELLDSNDLEKVMSLSAAKFYQLEL